MTVYTAEPGTRWRRLGTTEVGAHSEPVQPLPALNQALVQAAQMTGQILVSVPLSLLDLIC